MASQRETTLRHLDRLVQRGQLDEAILGYAQLIDESPEDRSLHNLLGDVYLRRGDEEQAIALFASVADYYREEGFHSKAAALYRKILKVRHDDHAMLGLVDIAAHQGLLAEAKQYLLELARVRRSQGDDAGAEEVLLSLQAVIEVDPATAAEAVGATATPEPGAMPPAPERPATMPDVPTAAAVEVSAPAPPAASASSAIEVPSAGIGEPLATASGNLQGPEEAFEEAAAAPAEQRLPPRAGGMRPLRQRRTPNRPHRPKKARSLQSVFNEMRQAAEQEEDYSAAHDLFDQAQYHLRDGRDDEAMSALEAASKAPMLRFKAAAQLGRLNVSRGDLRNGIEWLEQAAQVPPVSPDEGHAVLYELADALERASEPERALAVFIELSAQFRNYRDVQQRMARLLESPGQRSSA